jgi:tripartite-type tricarboxylate transporter receptor subunit TctC
MHRTIALCAALLCAPASVLAAADWPVKPVRIVVPYAAGGATDLLGRIFAEHLTAALGQQFFVENRAGGGGLPGSEAVARAEPDGYTLMIAGLPSHVLAPPMNKSTLFDPVKSFTHIAYLGGPPGNFVVHPTLGVKTFAEFLSRAKSEANGIQYVSPGTGTAGNILAEYFAAKAKVNLMHVSYRGGGAAILDLVAGHVKMGSMTVSTTIEHIRAGTLLPIAVSSAERLPELPNVPTFRELGYPDLVATTWFTLSGPPGLPPEIVEKLNQAVNAGLRQPEVQKRLRQEIVETRPMTPEEVTQFMKREVEKWVPVVKGLTKG